MRKWTKILPYIFLEWYAKKYCNRLVESDGSEWAELYGSDKPLKGAGVLIRLSNAKKDKTIIPTQGRR